MVSTLVPARPSVGPSPDPFGAMVEAVRSEFGVDKAVLLTTMPRGGLQVCRSSAGVEPGVRRYGADLHAVDHAAWNALINGSAAIVDATADAAVDGAFGGPHTVVCVRVESPVFGGYPGVLRVMNGGAVRARAIDADRVRALFERHFPADRAVAVRQSVFVGGRLVLGDGGSESAAFAAGVRALATAMAARHGSVAERDAVTDEDGARVAVQVSKCDAYPALGEGPVVFVSVPPRVADWAALRPDAFSADAELSRLAGAVAFMVEHFRRSPTLGDVADAVHLSQFHFHRRFSDLFGLTPKHLLYDLQLNEAQRMLADPQQPLASIARQCGFAHQSHFTSRFKQGTGLTPTRWRRREIERPTHAVG